VLLGKASNRLGTEQEFGARGIGEKKKDQNLQGSPGNIACRTRLHLNEIHLQVCNCGMLKQLSKMG
jgi:hypothetical protein